MSLTGICNVVVRRNIELRGIFIVKRFFATESKELKDEIVDVTSADEKPIFYLHVDTLSEEEINKKRNKSRLNTQHRNILMGLRPYDEPIEWYHNTVKYKRRMLGRYGLSAIDEPAGFAWPTPEEIEDAKEYERVAFPFSLQERWKKIEEKHQKEAIAIKKREREIFEKLAKMEHWTADLQARIAKKEAEKEKAKLRKQRLVEEVRRHFGFDISPNDQRFKDMIVQKEKQEKKMKKEAKKKARLEKLASFFQEEKDKEQPSEANQEQLTNSTKTTE